MTHRTLCPACPAPAAAIRKVLLWTCLATLCACGSDDADRSPDAAGTSTASAETIGMDTTHTAAADAETPFMAVDLFVGTGGNGFGVGSALPGATLPFSLVKLSPDTATKTGAVPSFMHCGGYAYGDSKILGFSHTHMHGIGVPAYGNVLFMPTRGTGPSRRTRKGRMSSFSHDSEIAEPGYYAVTLASSGVRAEVAAGQRVGYHRWTWAAGTPDSEAALVIDLGYALAQGEVLGGRIEVIGPEKRIRGWTRADGMHGPIVKVYFDAVFDTPFDSVQAWRDGETVEMAAGATTTVAAGKHVGAIISFARKGGAVVQAQVGISYVDGEGARANRVAEQVADFDAARARGRKAWTAALGQIEIEGGTTTQRRIFYSALYHALQHPTAYSDADGRYLGFDGKVHTTTRVFYTDYSLWDTYRTLHPLLILLMPGRAADMAQSLVTMAEQWGGLPRWPLGSDDSGSMIGTSADVVLAGTWLKGVKDFDIDTAWTWMKAHADGPVAKAGRDGILSYLKLGYVPSDETGGSVSKTQEYAWDDFALSNLAKARGQSADAATYDARSRTITTLWHAQSAFFHGRRADGSWEADITPDAWQTWYVEGDAWQHLWLTPHIDVLAQVMGGKQAVVARLDELFALSLAHWKETEGSRWLPLPYYWHGNEPDLHAAWLYIDAGAPAKAQRWVRWILDTHYGLGPHGLAGNDDAGTLSAWYIFASLGLYPVAGSSRYLVGTPMFTRAVVHLPSGELIIEGKGEGVYVQSATLDGGGLTEATLEHAGIAEGAELVFVRGGEGSKWGGAP